MIVIHCPSCASLLSLYASFIHNDRIRHSEMCSSHLPTTTRIAAFTITSPSLSTSDFEKISRSTSNRLNRYHLLHPTSPYLHRCKRKRIKIMNQFRMIIHSHVYIHVNQREKSTMIMYLLAFVLVFTHRYCHTCGSYPPRPSRNGRH